MSEPTRSVDLTLEESGVLCHLLLGEILKAEAGGYKGPLGADMRPFYERMTTLHQKLAAANDILMGKS
jgi:hypothetical protein